MKTAVSPAKSTDKRRASKWLPKVAEIHVSKAQANRFTDGLLAIAARMEGLPPDFAQNHDHYLHGLPRQ